MKEHIRVFFAALCIIACLASVRAGEPRELPGESLYQLDLPLETSEGKSIALSSFRGQTLLITMFYSHCTSVCPMITHQLQDLERRLAPRARTKMRVLMVSFDSAQDTPAELESFKQLHRINDPRWVVARADSDGVRALAAALGIRYRQLPDHSFNHTATIALADQEGVIKARVVGPQANDSDLLSMARSIAEEKETSRPGGE